MNSGPPPITICAPFDVVAETRDDSSVNWGIQIEWRDADNCPHTWVIPRTLLHLDGGAIAAQLDSLGLRCKPGRPAYDQLKNALAGVRIDKRLTCVSRPGWHMLNGTSVFVLPAGDVYNDDSEFVVLQDHYPNAARTFGQAGTPDEWQTRVAAYAVNNSRLALGICLAFAGPLLEIVGEPSGGIHLVGASQTGKTTIAFVTGSVWGRGERGAQIRSWRATASGLEGVAAECCDTVLILDELSQANGKEVADIVYSLANETGKSCADRRGDARASKNWRVMFLSTGEITLAEKLATAGQRITAGQEVRLVALPSDVGKGLGVFEALHDMESSAALVGHLRAAARTTYGTAGRDFLFTLAIARNDPRMDIAGDIQRVREGFIRDHLPAGADGQVRSIAGRFGLIAAAGELATSWGIVPWPAGEATRAAATCFKAFLNERGSTEPGEDIAAVAQVRGFLEAHGDFRFTPISHNITDCAKDRQLTINRVGFKWQVGKNKPNEEYLIFPEAWKNEVCRGLNATQAAATLRDRGYLRTESGGSLFDIR